MDSNINATETSDIKRPSIGIYIFFNIIILLVGALSSAVSLDIIIIAAIINSVLYSICVLLNPNLWLLITPILVVATVFFITGDPISIMASLYFAPVGLLIGYSILKKYTRVQTIIRSGFALIIMIILTLAIFIITAEGTVSYEAIDSIIKQLTHMYFDPIRELLASTIESEDQLTGLFETLVFSMKAMSLAMVITISFAFTFIVSYLVKKIVEFMHIKEVFFKYDNIWQIELSKIAAIVFVISTILMFIFSESDNIGLKFGIFTFYFPISAGLAVVGFRHLIEKVKKNYIILILFFVLFFILNYMIFYFAFILLTTFGLFRTLFKKPFDFMSNYKQ
ncbi:MAG: hypothetical protein A2Y17_12605 [Clostridiales bacterium GWF2_38_85]|nr:MAG: hypothetical protein A2Y17_12605 [Clostridiales bacterium GWF2_38_85]HBL84099.1 hypothetical protein [Clostridiales bacterium]